MNILEVLGKMEPNDVNYYFVARTLMSASRATKKKPASITIGVDDKTIENYLRFDEPDEIGILIHVPREKFIKLLEDSNADH